LSDRKIYILTAGSDILIGVFNSPRRWFKDWLTLL